MTRRSSWTWAGLLGARRPLLAAKAVEAFTLGNEKGVTLYYWNGTRFETVDVGD